MLSNLFTISSVFDDSAQALARMECINCRISLTNPFEAVGNVVVDIKITVQVSFHQHWNLRATLESAKGCSFPNTSSDQLKRTSRDFMTRSCDTNNAGGAPSTMAAFQCSTHNLGVTCAVKTIIDTPISHNSSNVLLNGLVNVIRVDAIRGTFEFKTVRLVLTKRVASKESSTEYVPSCLAMSNFFVFTSTAIILIAPAILAP